MVAHVSAHPASIALAAAPVNFGIRIENFPPYARFGQGGTMIILARNRRQIADDDDRLLAGCLALPCENGVVIIIDNDPLKPFWLAIARMQRLLGPGR